MAQAVTLVSSAGEWPDIPVYEDVQGADVATQIYGSSVSIGQGAGADWGDPPAPRSYSVNRGAIWFDLTSIPVGSSITACTLKLYGLSSPDNDFDLYMVSADCNDPIENQDFSKLGSADLGYINTSGWTVSAVNTLTFNAAGLIYLNAAIPERKVCIGFRSSDDIDISAPLAKESNKVVAESTGGDNPPLLTVTVSTWPDVYPSTANFPVTGQIDLPTYGVISTSLAGLDIDIRDVFDGDGNLNLAVANWITWTGTSEKIAYDDANSRVTVTTLAASSVVTVAGDLVSDDVTGEDITAVDGAIANDLIITYTFTPYNDAIKGVAVDNEIVFTGGGIQTPSDNDGMFYMESASGDFFVKTRDEGQAGIKTLILGDFSGM